MRFCARARLHAKSELKKKPSSINEQEKLNMAESIPKRRRRIRARENHRVYSKTRIVIGKAFERWRELKELNIFKSDAEVALFLLDR